MPTEVNAIITEKDGNLITEPLTVTIALEEYRCLVKETARLEERAIHLEKRLLEYQKREAENNA